MYFIDFTKRKIVKSYNFHECEITIPLSKQVYDGSILDLKAAVKQAMADKIVAHETATSFVIHVVADWIAAEDEDDQSEFFLALTNTIIIELFSAIVLPTKRQQEYRLDAPAEMKKYARMSFGLLKQASNNEMTNNIINLSIDLNGDFFYDLLDQTQLSQANMQINSEEREFKHDFDEQ